MDRRSGRLFARVCSTSSHGFRSNLPRFDCWRFPLAIWDKTILRDGEVNVAFKAVDGEIDRAAGVVWRYKDPNNYYIVRANALENNVVLYKVQGGRAPIDCAERVASRAYGVKHDVPTGKWRSMRVVFKEHLFTVSLNGSPVFEVEDQTFNEPGKVGLWTKADSVTYFADFVGDQVLRGLRRGNEKQLLQ